MKRSLIIIILLVQTFSWSFGQKNDFEKELNLFRFNLNRLLEKYDDDKILQQEFYEDDTIVLLIDSFLVKNKFKIRNYKENILKKHENYSNVLFDVEKYKKVNVEKTSTINKVFKRNISTYKLLFINPLTETELYKTLYLSRIQGYKEFEIYQMKKGITSSLIQTQKIDKNRWEIIDNSYDFIYKFIYDLEKEEIIHSEVLERKKE